MSGRRLSEVIHHWLQPLVVPLCGTNANSLMPPDSNTPLVGTFLRWVGTVRAHARHTDTAAGSPYAWKRWQSQLLMRRGSVGGVA